MFRFVFFRIFYWVSRRLQLSRVSSTTFLTWGQFIKSKLWIFLSILSIYCFLSNASSVHWRIQTYINGSVEWVPDQWSHQSIRMNADDELKRNKKKIIWIWLSSIGRSRKIILRCCEKLPNFKLLNGKSLFIAILKCQKVFLFFQSIGTGLSVIRQ
jgi:hypothetical protein